MKSVSMDKIKQYTKRNWDTVAELQMPDDTHFYVNVLTGDVYSYNCQEAQVYLSKKPQVELDDIRVTITASHAYCFKEDVKKFGALDMEMTRLALNTVNCLRDEIIKASCIRDIQVKHVKTTDIPDIIVSDSYDGDMKHSCIR